MQISTEAAHRVSLAVALIAIALVLVLSISNWNWAVVWDNRIPLLRGMQTSLMYTLVCGGIGLALGTILAIARERGPRVIQYITAGTVELIRGVPQILLLLGVHLVLPEITGARLSAEAAGTIGLSAIAAVYFSEVIRSGLSSVPEHQWESGYVTGLTRVQTFWHVIAPQVVKNMAPALIAMTVLLFKTTTLLYVLGIVDFFRAAALTNTRVLEPGVIYVFVSVVYVLVCGSMSPLIYRMANGKRVVA
jgi:His/Glu/Gln/Arg/opine family amino acid ABC transporter permease subunit